MNYESRLEAMIEPTHAGSPAEAVDQALLAIETSAQIVTDDAKGRLSRSLTAAAARTHRVVSRIADKASEVAQLHAEAVALPATDWIQALWSGGYVLAGIAALITEGKLSTALTYVLDFKETDVTAKWMCFAFAAALLFFDLMFRTLGLTGSPWTLLKKGTSDSEKQQDGESKLMPRLRVAAACALVLVLVGIAVLQVHSISLMAPVRDVAATIKLNNSNLDAPPIPIDRKVIREAVLWFSICVLISGGFLAAAGLEGLRLYRRHYVLNRQQERCSAEIEMLQERLDSDLKPALAAELQIAGLPFLWLLSSVKPEEFERHLVEMQSDGKGTTPQGMDQAAAKVGAFFEAEQRQKLEIARARQLVPASALDQVGMTLGHSMRG